MKTIEMQNKEYNFVNESIIKNKKVSHAYFIETNGFDDYMVFVKYLIKSILCINISDELEKAKLCENVDKDNYPDIKYIYPELNVIKKEQLLSLEKEFSKKSMLDNKLIYVINNAEMLNDSSANSILKFLEEPEENIIAILVSNSRYKIIETILSRCQIISMINDNKNNDEISEDILNLLEIFSTSATIVKFDYYFEKLFENKQIAKKNIIILEKMFFDYLNKLLINKKINMILSKFEDSKIIKFLLIINESKKELEYNVNMKLWFNKLLIKLIEVN